MLWKSALFCIFRTLPSVSTITPEVTKTQAVFKEKYLNLNLHLILRPRSVIYFCLNFSLVLRCDHHFLLNFEAVAKNISHYLLILFAECNYTHDVIIVLNTLFHNYTISTGFSFLHLFPLAFLMKRTPRTFRRRRGFFKVFTCSFPTMVGVLQLILEYCGSFYISFEPWILLQGSNYHFALCILWSEFKLLWNENE